MQPDENYAQRKLLQYQQAAASASLRQNAQQQQQQAATHYALQSTDTSASTLDNGYQLEHAADRYYFVQTSTRYCPERFAKHEATRATKTPQELFTAPSASHNNYNICQPSGNVYPTPDCLPYISPPSPAPCDRFIPPPDCYATNAFPSPSPPTPSLSLPLSLPPSTSAEHQHQHQHRQQADRYSPIERFLPASVEHRALFTAVTAAGVSSPAKFTYAATPAERPVYLPYPREHTHTLPSARTPRYCLERRYDKHTERYQEVVAEQTYNVKCSRTPERYATLPGPERYATQQHVPASAHMPVERYVPQTQSGNEKYQFGEPRYTGSSCSVGVSPSDPYMRRDLSYQQHQQSYRAQTPSQQHHHYYQYQQYPARVRYRTTTRCCASPTPPQSHFESPSSGGSSSSAETYGVRTPKCVKHHACASTAVTPEYVGASGGRLISASTTPPPDQSNTCLLQCASEKPAVIPKVAPVSAVAVTNACCGAGTSTILRQSKPNRTMTKCPPTTPPHNTNSW